MRYKIKNEKLTAEIESLGAELKSLKGIESEQEYMWYGDPKYYARTSPILFPFVGSLKNKEYRYAGKTYAMPQHGFARDMDFEVEEEKEGEIWFVLKSDASTMEKYPFEFVFHIGYRLEETSIKVMWKVENVNEKTMYFSIGAHCEFNCPLKGEESKNGYALDFHTEHNIDASKINEEGLMLNTKEELQLENGRMMIPEHFFDEGAYIIEKYQTNQVSLVNPSGETYVTISFDAPLFGVWSREKKNAPFVAIEPWYGRCDRDTFEGTLEQREWGNKLDPHECFEKSYRITVGE